VSRDTSRMTDRLQPHGLDSVAAGIPHVSLELPHPLGRSVTSLTALLRLCPDQHSYTTSLLKCCMVTYFSQSECQTIKVTLAGIQKYHIETFWQLTIPKQYVVEKHKECDLNYVKLHDHCRC